VCIANLALRSSANDLLNFLAATLGFTDSPLQPAMAAMLSLRGPATGGLDVGLGWHIFRNSGIIWHNGGTYGFSSFIGYDPARRAGVVVLSDAFTTDGAMTGVDDIGVHLLIDAVPLNAQPQRHTAVSVDPGVFDHYAGRYQLAPNFILAVTREETHLMAQATGLGKFELFPEGVMGYFAKVGGIGVTFETNDQGAATGLILHQNGRDIRAPRIEK
jgi:serine-type D-Ala-D-Ala carboxypeptidase/endopeptidase